MKPRAGKEDRRSWLAAVAAALALASGCAGGTCRGHGDCASGRSCVGPNDPRACGVPPHRECAADADCAAGLRCHATADPCSPNGVGSRCGPACAAACDAGFRCSAAGACEPLPCDEGFVCPAHQRCDVAVAHAGGPVHGRTQGCVSRACKADGDCPAGQACVNAVCQTGPGACREDTPVP